MKKLQILFTLMALMALTFVLAGCPKSDKMMGETTHPVQVERIG